MAQAYVVLKLADEETADAVVRTPNLRDLDSVSKMLGKRFPGSSIRPLFASLEPMRIQDLMARAAAKRKTTTRPRNLLNYHRITCGSELEAKELAKSLSALPNVETAYVEGRVTDANLNPPIDVYAVPHPELLNKFPPTGTGTPYTHQGYLDEAPYGIDARYGWTLLGGDGEGTSLVAVQDACFSDHQDLREKNVTALSGLNRYDITHDPDHGRHATMVLGIVCGMDNDVGIVGIAPHVSPVQISSRMLSPEVTPEELKTLPYAPAILAAADQMQPGGVLFLPLGVDGPEQTIGGKTYVQTLPVEVEPANFDAIEHATSLGIIVVEAAANGVAVKVNDVPINPDPQDQHIGGVDLDEFRDANGKYVLNREKQGHFKDSGAIMVGAALAEAVPRGPQPLPLGHNRADARRNVSFGTSGSGSNYGSRVDCYAWGQKVLTADTRVSLVTPFPTPTEKRYSAAAAGTSAASAIIAGAALCLQGVIKAWKNRTLTPEEMRAALSHHPSGTPQAKDVPGKIGVMPDLKKVIQAFGNNPPPAL